MSDTATVGSEAPVDRLAHDLRRSISDFVRAVRQDAGTPRSAQTEALDLLSRLGPMNVAALAERRRVTHQAMRLSVAPLLAAGSVCQVTDPMDRRSRRLSISTSGRDLLAQEQDARASHIKEAILNRLSPAERDLLRSAIPLLDRLAARPPSTPDEGA